MDPSYFEKVAKSANTFLTRWDGACVLVRELTVSLRTLRIVLFADRATMPQQNLVLSISPLWMSGPFEWRDAHLRVEVTAANVTPVVSVVGDGQLFRLHDPGGFALLSESLEVAENVKLR